MKKRTETDEETDRNGDKKRFENEFLKKKISFESRNDSKKRAVLSNQIGCHPRRMGRRCMMGCFCIAGQFSLGSIRDWMPMVGFH